MLNLDIESFSIPHMKLVLQENMDYQSKLN